MSDAEPSSSQQQGKKKRSRGATRRMKAERKRLKEEEKRLKWVEPKDFTPPVEKRDPRPKREAAKVNFDDYLRSKNYLPRDVRAIQTKAHVWAFVSVKEDVCPIPVRLAPLGYPKQYFLHNDHFGPLKENIMKRNAQAQKLSGPGGPQVLEVLQAGGYALVLAKDDFTVEFVRGLIPLLAADGMPVKEATQDEIKQFNATRGERCDLNILVKYRKHGWRIRQQAAQRRGREEEEWLGEEDN